MHSISSLNPAGGILDCIADRGSDLTPSACAQPGVFDPAGLARLDLILATAGKYGVKVILPFVNFWNDLGGMQWWLDNVSHASLRSVFPVCESADGLDWSFLCSQVQCKGECDLRSVEPVNKPC